MVAFIIIVRFIAYFCISFIVQNNVIDKGEMAKCRNILRNMWLFFSYIYIREAFHPSEVDKMSTRNFWELGGIK